jgi:A/G-specific adenine glycosylase
MNMPAELPLRNFREIIWNYYHDHARSMPWRDNPSPYHVLVSELMLQQTQVGRVLPKYDEFMATFPTIQALSKAPLGDVLSAWSGLGYNRRAKFLHVAAQKVMQDFGGELPDTIEGLVSLPGVGKNTAGAILCYAFNQPVPFIETNVRSVFIHHFFNDRTDVDDKELLPIVRQACDLEHPREWYWALMDYGTYLKQTLGNNISQSKHYARQSKFEGSRRQVRGRVLKMLTRGPVMISELLEAEPDERTPSVIADLQREGFVEENGDQLRLTGSSKLP